MISLKSNILYDYQITDKVTFSKILFIQKYHIYASLCSYQTKIKLWKQNFTFLKSLNSKIIIDEFIFCDSMNALVSSCKNFIEIWNLMTGIPIYKISSVEFLRIKFKLIDDYLFYFGETKILEKFNNNICVWNIEKLNKLNVGSEKIINDVVSLQKGDRIAYCFKNSIVIMNYVLGIKIKTIKNQFNCYVNFLEYYKDSAKNIDVLISIEDKKMVLFDLKNYSVIINVEFTTVGCAINLKQISFSNSYYLIVGFNEGIIQFFDLRNGMIIHNLSDFKKESITLKNFLYEGNILCIVGSKGRLMVYELIYFKK
jgi:WD40 repeat protein